MPATLLQKALDPQIWPLRVRVREYIHYRNEPKQSRSSTGNASTPASGPPVQQQQSPFSHMFVAGVPNVPTFSRFDPLMNMGQVPNNL